MVWKSNGQQGSEAAKVAFDIVHLMHGRVLDLGCGPQKVFPHAKHVIGIDNDKDAKIFGLKANPDIPASCERLDMFADGSVDVVFSSHMLEHIKDYKASLRDWWRVIKPGGRLILYLPHRDWYPNIGMPGANIDHQHDFAPDDITEAMREIVKPAPVRPEMTPVHGWTQEIDETRSGGNEYSFLQVYRKRLDARIEVFEPKPKPKKSLGLVRLGAYGDALWITTVLPKLRGIYDHITLYTQKEGDASLRNDPNIDEMRVQPDAIFGSGGEAWQAQTLYWLHCTKKHDEFINLVGCVERHLLPHPADPNFWLPDGQRRRLMGRNYLEAVHEWAGVTFDPKTVRIKFTPTAEEIAWAAAERARFEGPVVVINPSGSSAPKWWPHTQAAMEMLDKEGVHTVVLGDLRAAKFKPPARARVIGTEWTIRKCYTFAALADVVIGTESAIINSVAHEKPLKIVMLSHSTGFNLTRDWSSTIALEPEGLACYPCHRIHQNWDFCARDTETGAAVCQKAATAETVVGYAMQWIRGEMKEAA